MQDKRALNIKPKSDKKEDSKKQRIIKQQVLALGGDEQDYDLVKDIESEEIGAATEVDVCIFVLP